jgi:tRNA/tmRNA/rRNA uracil-C5-methylase (TrmA/RlmC/RlmD family)
VRGGVVGFFGRESNRLLDIERCPIALNEVNAQLAELRRSRPRDGHYTLRASAGSRVFTQANDAVAASMLDLVDRLLGLATGTLIDAYCGAGFFSKRLRGRFEKVIGIDWDRHAIAVARQDANENEVYVATNVETELGAQLRSIALGSSEGNSALIVDPPATGLSKMILETLIENQPTQLIYVSCNPATLARDLAALKESFRIDSITPLDMFPQTAEIECVAHLA